MLGISLWLCFHVSLFGRWFLMKYILQNNLVFKVFYYDFSTHTIFFYQQRFGLTRLAIKGGASKIYTLRASVKRWCIPKLLGQLWGDNYIKGIVFCLIAFFSGKQSNLYFIPMFKKPVGKINDIKQLLKKGIYWMIDTAHASNNVICQGIIFKEFAS